MKSSLKLRDIFFCKFDLVLASLLMIAAILLVHRSHASVTPSPTDPGWVTYQQEKCSTNTATCTAIACSVFMSGTATLSANGTATISVNAGQFGNVSFTVTGAANATVNWTLSSNFTPQKQALAYWCTAGTKQDTCTTHGLGCGNYNLFIGGGCSGQILKTAIGWISTCGK